MVYMKRHQNLLQFSRRKKEYFIEILSNKFKEEEEKIILLKI